MCLDNHLLALISFHFGRAIASSVRTHERVPRSSATSSRSRQCLLLYRPNRGPQIPIYSDQGFIPSPHLLSLCRRRRSQACTRHERQRSIDPDSSSPQRTASAALLPEGGISSLFPSLSFFRASVSLRARLSRCPIIRYVAWRCGSAAARSPRDLPQSLRRLQANVSHWGGAHP